MLRQLLLLLCVCFLAVHALSKEEIASVKADLDKEVAKLGGTKKEDNLIVQGILHDLELNDIKHGSLAKQLDKNTAKQLPKKKKETEESSVISSKDEENLYQLLIQGTSRAADKELNNAIIKTVQRNQKRVANEELVQALIQNQKEIKLKEEAEKQSELDLDLQMLSKNEVAADKELINAIIRTVQRNQKRAANEELVQALIQNQKEIKLKEEAEKQSELDLDLQMLSKNEVDMTKAILETFKGEKKKKDVSKKSEADKLLTQNLLRSMINDEVQQRKKETTNQILEDLIKEVELKKKDLQLMGIKKTLAASKKEGRTAKKKDAATEKLLNLYLQDAVVAESGNIKVTDYGCEDKVSHCAALAKYCDTHTKQLGHKCRKTCGLCKSCRKDVWKESTCKTMLAVGYCDIPEHKEQLKINCYTTCGYCRVPSPPACQQNRHGCCWDNTSFVSKGCPACEDNASIRAVCWKFRDDCNSSGLPGKFMKQQCPLTCKLCVPCEDSPDMGRHGCRSWMSSKGCEVFPDLAEKFCFKTCMNCKSRLSLKKLEKYHGRT